MLRQQQMSNLEFLFSISILIAFAHTISPSILYVVINILPYWPDTSLPLLYLNLPYKLTSDSFFETDLQSLLHSKTFNDSTTIYQIQWKILMINLNIRHTNKPSTLAKLEISLGLPKCLQILFGEDRI